MSIEKLKRYILKEVRKIVTEKNNPLIAPTKPDVMEPGTKPEIKPKRRTLNPDKETTPDTKPKASVKESEAELIKKITQRFKKLK